MNPAMNTDQTIVGDLNMIMAIHKSYVGKPSTKVSICEYQKPLPTIIRNITYYS